MGNRISLKAAAVVICSIFTGTAFVVGQDLESLVQSVPGKEITQQIRIMPGPLSGNGPSVETAGEKELLFILGHRFGKVSGGFYEFFGLDQATMRLGFEYGILPVLSAGFGRSTFEKSWDIYGKLRIIRQGVNNSPLSSTLFISASVNTLQGFYPQTKDALSDRLTCSAQLITALKTRIASFQLSPGYVYGVFDPVYNFSPGMLFVGSSANIPVTKRMALQVEYYFLLGNLPYKKTNPLTFVMNIDTGGHLFQLLFSNATGMFPKSLLVNTSGIWSKGDIYFGFNLIRTFTLSKQ